MNAHITESMAQAALCGIDPRQTDGMIIFSDPMVQAILRGDKTQTRRPIKPVDNHRYADIILLDDPHQIQGLAKPPHKVGAVLYVREAFRLVGFEYVDDDWNASVQYRADNTFGPRMHWLKHGASEKIGWRPAIHMPREAARIFLRITDVRAERLQDISTDDCIAEGVDCDNEIVNPDPTTHQSILHYNHTYAQFLYKELWDSIYAKRYGGIYIWDANPWVWRYVFEVLK
jgi:hypothetical protein